MTDPYRRDESRPPSQIDGPSDAEPAETEARAGEEAAAPEAAPPREIGESSSELDEQRDRYLRLAAEYENFRKRSTREREEARHRAQGDLVVGLLDALDDLSRFAHLDPAVTDSKTVVDGAELVERKLLKSLAGHGLESIDPVDHPFDPALHEAVQSEAALSPEDDHMVSQVFQRGYVFNGRLLRPARVSVKQWRDDVSPNE